MTTTMPSRKAIDAAGDLDFTPRTKAEPLTITVHATIAGFATELCFVGSIDQLPALAARLVALGATPTATPTTAAAAPRKAGERVTPAYNGAGEPCCTVHTGRVLKQGKYGLFCSAKGEDEQYCNLKFKD